MMNTYLTEGDTRPSFIALGVTAEVPLAVVADPEIGNNIVGEQGLNSSEAVGTNYLNRAP